MKRDKTSSDQQNTEDLFDFAHELWAVAQVFPNEGIEDAVWRIVELLKQHEGGETP